MFRSMFKKTYTKINDAGEKHIKSGVPEGMWRKCAKCLSPVYAEGVRNNYYICPKCGGYFRVHAYRRIEMICDKGSFEEWNKVMPVSNPLQFPGYEEKIAEAKLKSKLDEAVVTGKACIDGIPVVIAACDARFLMSSMGHNVGEKITYALERAADEKLPVIIYSCSGGARMQEGIVSLMQMAKTSAAVKKLHEAGQLYISFLTDPTTGGVTASFAMLGDIILAEPKALIGFAGPRVIAQTIGTKLPEGFQRAEFLLEHGFVDAIVERKDQKAVLGNILKTFKNRERCSKAAGTVKCNESSIKDKSFIPDDSPGFSSKKGKSGDNLADYLRKDKAAYTQKAASYGHNDIKDGLVAGKLKKINEIVRIRSGKVRSDKSAWESVLISRKKDRLTAKDYIDEMFSDFFELHGDRYFADDKAIIGGTAFFNKKPVMVIGQQKGKNLKENKLRNFGMPSPEGYRKVIRLMKLAEAFKLPVICFVDTPGAFCGIEAEERGQGEAIARCLYEAGDLKTPVLSIVIGEGGSGGALAMAVANEVWMLEHAIYSILSPEGFASILYKDAAKCKEAAQDMRITSADLLNLGIIEKIIPEKKPVCMDNIDEIISYLGFELEKWINKYSIMSKEELVKQRYERYRKF